MPEQCPHQGKSNDRSQSLVKVIAATIGLSFRPVKGFGEDLQMAKLGCGFFSDHLLWLPSLASLDWNFNVLEKPVAVLPLLFMAIVGADFRSL